MHRSLLSLTLLLSALPGCIFVADDEPEPVAARSEFTGTLLVDWTINGTTDPDECDQGAATWLTLSIFTSSGQHVGDFTDACDAFSTSVELDPGSYYADALLEDVDGAPRTTAVAIDDFSILGNDTLSIPIEFSASSFY
jgi:hypothetical protein